MLGERAGHSAIRFKSIHSSPSDSMQETYTIRALREMLTLFSSFNKLVSISQAAMDIQL